jgi:hypothetical protein
MFFGNLIQGVREKDGRSLEEIARQAGMTVAEWKALEAGQVPSTSEQPGSWPSVLKAG